MGRRVGRGRYTVGAGPGVEVFRIGGPVVVADLSEQHGSPRRWWSACAPHGGELGLAGWPVTGSESGADQGLWCGLSEAGAQPAELGGGLLFAGGHGVEYGGVSCCGTGLAEQCPGDVDEGGQEVEVL